MLRQLTKTYEFLQRGLEFDASENPTQKRPFSCVKSSSTQSIAFEYKKSVQFFLLCLTETDDMERFAH